jgi:hypothetical protein
MAPDSGDPTGAGPRITDPAITDPTVMESAMDTGSDAGEPGDRSDGGPLTDDERALLDRLVEEANDRSTVVVTDAPEDSPAAAAAVADDTVLPDPAADGSVAVDPHTPEFRAP